MSRLDEITNAPNVVGFTPSKVYRGLTREQFWEVMGEVGAVHMSPSVVAVGDKLFCSDGLPLDGDFIAEQMVKVANQLAPPKRRPWWKRLAGDAA